VLGEISAYHDPFSGVVIATRLRSGWARAVGEPGEGLGLHPQKRFFAGGPNSVRGFAQYRLGPKLLTVDAARVLTRPAEQGGAGCTAHEINAGDCDVSRWQPNGRATVCAARGRCRGAGGQHRGPLPHLGRSAARRHLP
jgi:hypothetical protein